ncbi:hypothetical protein MPTK1_5g13120 [Marchantia polymorpha subsp. ruderalis]|uniref:Uncharacterized protein n=2 Tax=Marchantia polymorpha TaxID=3197 RepID=A0AAF6BHU5_MARPO|nr:hypothetical protein MARPO_0032s0006 [Marchantia polymorpha]BBN11579.1 hypothetical protein Mp_5g13120 [Marchantia polymorpha subsp. ruderalis]|eukprot:PTQ41794.1 hypothetical protein MARPO_0032s0006 [Marchantia polymorpha]
MHREFGFCSVTTDLFCSEVNFHVLLPCLFCGHALVGVPNQFHLSIMPPASPRTNRRQAKVGVGFRCGVPGLANDSFTNCFSVSNSCFLCLPSYFLYDGKLAQGLQSRSLGALQRKLQQVGRADFLDLRTRTSSRSSSLSQSPPNQLTLSIVSISAGTRQKGRFAIYVRRHVLMS